VDVAPSLLELAGAPALPGIHGRSWKTLVQQGDPAWRKSWLYHYNYEKQFPYTPNVRAVRTETWKYSRSPHGDGEPDRHQAELYNIEFDPEERHNLIDRPKYATVVRDMQRELLTVLREVGLTPANDTMPLDAGIKQELPDQKIR
jgi:arylsulfatase A-like enzyme